ncbi:EAL domain-containing protein [Vibrio sp. F74]|uniref:EAL domain-containing protein n=1 Tax=Vibrio sp. F74 TaxID=700020 RepID=UPI0035F59946
MENDQHLPVQVNNLRLELTSVQDTNEQLAYELGKSNQRFILAMRGANEGGGVEYEEDELEGNLSTWKSLVYPDEKRSVLMAHSLEYNVVAEGVEYVEPLNLLKKLGCDLAQGYLVSQR